MPELPRRFPQVATDFSEPHTKVDAITRAREVQATQEGMSFVEALDTIYHEVKLIGKGGECVVIEDPRIPEQVVAFHYIDKSPEKETNEETNALKMLSIFYQHKILNILFPKNFPNIIATTFGDADPISVREKVKGGKTDSNLSHLEGALKKVGFRVNLDSAGVNYIVDEKDNIKYLDTVIEMRFLSAIDGASVTDLLTLARQKNTEDVNEVALNKYLIRLKEVAFMREYVDKGQTQDLVKRALKTQERTPMNFARVLKTLEAHGNITTEEVKELEEQLSGVL